MIKGRIKTPDISQWDVLTNRAIAFLDIMGFKDLILRKEHLDIYSMMTQIYNAINSTIDAFGIDNPEEGTETSIYSTTYSDSIIIYSKDGSKECLGRFVSAVSSLTDDLYEEGIPFKGSIAFGNMTLDFKKSIFFGQPLVDAYLLQEELNLYSVVIHGSAEQVLQELDTNLLYEYNCPFKSGSAMHATVLPFKYFTGMPDTTNQAAFIDVIKKYKHNTSGSLRKYVDNTLAYFNSVADHKFLF